MFSTKHHGFVSDPPVAMSIRCVLAAMLLYSEKSQLRLICLLALSVCFSIGGLLFAANRLDSYRSTFDGQLAYAGLALAVLVPVAVSRLIMMRRNRAIL